MLLNYMEIFTEPIFHEESFYYFFFSDCFQKTVNKLASIDHEAME